MIDSRLNKEYNWEICVLFLLYIQNSAYLRIILEGNKELNLNKHVAKLISVIINSTLQFLNNNISLNVSLDTRWYIKTKEFFELESEINNKNMSIEKTINNSYTEADFIWANYLIIGDAGKFTNEQLLNAQEIFIKHTFNKKNNNYLYRVNKSGIFTYKDISMVAKINLISHLTDM